MVIMSPNFMVSGPPVMHSGTLLSSHLHFGSALHPINITVVDFFFFFCQYCYGLPIPSHELRQFVVFLFCSFSYMTVWSAVKLFLFFVLSCFVLSYTSLKSEGNILSLSRGLFTLFNPCRPPKNVFHRDVVLLRHHAVLDETLTVWHAVTSEQIYTSFWWTFYSQQYFVRHKSNFPLSAEGRLKTYVCNTITWCSNRDGLGAIRKEKCLNCSGSELIFSIFHCAYIKMT